MSYSSHNGAQNAIQQSVSPATPRQSLSGLSTPSDFAAAKELKQQIDRLKTELCSKQSRSRQRLYEKSTELKRVKTVTANGISGSASIGLDIGHTTVVGTAGNINSSKKPQRSLDLTPTVSNGACSSSHSCADRLQKHTNSLINDSLSRGLPQRSEHRVSAKRDDDSTPVPTLDEFADVITSRSASKTEASSLSDHSRFFMPISSTNPPSSTVPPSSDSDSDGTKSGRSTGARTWVVETDVCALSATSSCLSGAFVLGAMAGQDISGEHEHPRTTDAAEAEIPSSLKLRALTTVSSKTTSGSALSAKIAMRDDRDSEKQWQLQRRVTDLTAQMAHYEKRITALKEENDLSKLKGEELKASEEKVKQLKKRNAELAAIARKLEDKLKQHDSLKRTKDITTSNTDMTVAGKTTKLSPKDRMTSKSVDDKDRIIECLREKCQELSHQAGLQKERHLENVDIYSSTSQLEHVLRQAAKERIMLERRLAELQRPNPAVESQLQRLQDLEEINTDLENQISQLNEELNDKEALEIEVVQRRVEVEVLNRELIDTQQKCSQLEKELNDLMTKNTQLSVANSDLRQQIEQLEKVSVQYDAMETRLKVSETEAAAAKEEMKELRVTVDRLQLELQCMDKLVEQKKQVEAEKQQALEQLRLKQLECDSLVQAKQSDDLQHKASVNKLEDQMQKLERQCVDLRVEKQRMAEEIERMNREYEQKLVSRRSPGHTGSSRRIPNDRRSDFDGNRNMNNGAASSTASCASNTPSLTDHAIHAGLFNDKIDAIDAGISQSETESRMVNGVACHLLNFTSDDEEEEDVEQEFDRSELGLDGSGSPRSTLIRVFVVLYDYDPEQSSPNDEPDFELSLKTGEYVFITGDMDDDGFYEGELMDGRRGLVPSNFVSQLPDVEAAELYSMMALQMADNCGDSIGLHQGEPAIDNLRNVEPFDDSTYGAMAFDTSNDDVDNLTTDRPSVNGDRSPPTAEAPLSVQVESGPDHGSLMVNWLPVTIAASGMSNGIPIAGYSVYVNGTRVKELCNPTGDHLLLEFEDLQHCDIPRFISVRTLTVSGLESEDSVPAVLPDQLVRDITAEMRSVELHSAVNSEPDVEGLTADKVDGCENQSLPISPQDPRDSGLDRQSDKLLAPDSRGPFCGISSKISGSSASVTSSPSRPHENAVAVCRSASEPTVRPVAVTLSPKISDNQMAAAGIRSSRESTIGETAEDCCRSDDAALASSSCKHVAGSSGACGNTPALETCQLRNTPENDKKRKQKHGETLASQPKAMENGYSHGKGLRTPTLNGNSSINEEEVSPDAVIIDEKTSVIADVDQKTSAATDLTFAANDLPDRLDPPVTAAGVAAFPIQRSEITLSSLTLNGGGSVWRKVEPRRNSLLAPAPDVRSMENIARLPSISGAGFSGTLAEGGIARSGKKSESMYGMNAEPVLPTPIKFNSLQRNAKHTISRISPGVDGADSPPRSGSVPMEFNLRQPAEIVPIDDTKFAAAALRPQPAVRTEREPAAEADDNDSRATDDYSYELVDNRMVTSHHLREIPDSELVDYSDDGGESLIDSSSMCTGGADDDQRQVRIFVGLFDYDPSTMSPNPDAADTELPFTEGQIIKIYGDQDADGFYVGECNGRRGLVPSNMVSLVEVDDPDIAMQLLQESSRGHRVADGNSITSSRSSSRTSGVTARTTSTISRHAGTAAAQMPVEAGGSGNIPHGVVSPVRYMIALYNYNPLELSPNEDADQELAFNRGDVIAIFGDVDDDGFYLGEVDGRCGLVPSNFLQAAPPDFIASS